MSTPKLTVRVARKTLAADGICCIELVAANDAVLPAFTAGSHIDVYLPGGIVRQYSLCNDPDETGRYVLGVLSDPNSRGGSRAMHEVVLEGDSLEISVPRNHFELSPNAQQHVLFAGGIGVTPILSMVHFLARNSQPFKLHYCTRSKATTAFVEPLSAAPLAAHVTHYFDDAIDAPKLELECELKTLRPGTHIYVCGPKGFMDWVLGTARSCGWPESQLHYEFFAAQAPDLSEAGSFDVRIASSGQVIHIAKDKTVVQALAECGIEIETSCEQGICGTCLTGVKEGRPDHKDLFLTPEEHDLNDQFTPCCSRSLTPLLVLDL
ncbi:PDR/VanB family oxidoreductase [Ottowia thiooxydans]|uniref:Vanillate O-demethylase ferredoxin subunit n=1 Tax=Ottowia thiooxydans TaxID=219182 RepID=A0ABV2QC69_9BURK